MENNIFNSYFTDIFVPPCIYRLIISNMLPRIYACVYGYMIQHDSGLQSFKYLILDSTHKSIRPPKIFSHVFDTGTLYGYKDAVKRWLLA